MSKASKLINAIWDEKNLVSSNDTTIELVRKHRLFTEITQAISNDELQRGRDFGGTEEDSIYNDLSECEELLYERAIMRHDREAMDYISDNKVDGIWWMQQQLSKAKSVYAMIEGLGYPFLTEPKNLLKEIVPNDYPISKDNDND